MKLEVEFRRDVPIWELLEGQTDIQADGLATGLTGAKIRRLHDPRAPAGGDDEPMPLGLKLHRPLRQQEREPTRIFIVASHLDGSLCPLELQRVLASVQRSIERGRLLVFGSRRRRAGLFE